MSETSGANGEITVQTVEHLADLARIALTPAEITTLSSELDSILHNIAKVSEVASDDVPATSHPIPLANVFRPDVVGDMLTVEQVLQNAPDAAEGRFRVTAILGEEQ